MSRFLQSSLIWRHQLVSCSSPVLISLCFSDVSAFLVLGPIGDFSSRHPIIPLHPYLLCLSHSCFPPDFLPGLVLVSSPSHLAPGASWTAVHSASILSISLSLTSRHWSEMGTLLFSECWYAVILLPWLKIWF